MASPNTPSRGKLRGYSEYSLRTSVKMEKNKIDLESKLTRLEDETTRKMTAHRARLRKLEVDMARRHAGASPTQQRKSPTDEAGNNMLFASLPDFGHKRSSSYSNLALEIPTSPASSRTFGRSRSHSGNELKPSTRLPEIRISSNEEASDERRHTVPVIQVSPLGSDRRRYTAPSIQISPPKKTTVSQKSSPLLNRKVIQPSPPQTPSPAESPKSLSRSPDAHRWRPIQRMRSTPVGSLGGSKTPPLISPLGSPSANTLSCSHNDRRLAKSFSDLRTANLSQPAKKSPPAKQQLTLEEQFEMLKTCRYLRQPLKDSDDSLSRSQ